MKKKEKNSKWYSNDLTAEEAGKLEKVYAKIMDSTYGINDRGSLALQFSLRLENGNETNYQLLREGDIRTLLAGTQAFEVSKLKRRIIEVFKDGNFIRSIGINENLI